jgi:hypothetical protein
VVKGDLEIVISSVTWNAEGVDRVLRAPGLSDADRIAILGGNAIKLLGMGSY